VLHAKALPAILMTVTPCGTLSRTPRQLTGCAIERAYVDKGYRGHDTENPRRVFISGQKRGVFGVIKRELRRRSAIEPVIGHLKAEGHLGRCYLKGRAGDAANDSTMRSRKTAAGQPPSWAQIRTRTSELCRLRLIENSASWP
jgi:IS5 family transposase